MLLLCLAAVLNPMPMVLPQPVSVSRSFGDLRLQAASIQAPASFATEATQARQALKAAGIATGSGAVIRLQKGRPKLSGDEAYDLKVSPGGVTITGATSHAVFNGIQSLRQLIVKKGNGSFTVPQVEIHDAPRFTWRGFMLDASRHFFSVADTKHFIDVASQYKINTFHWHLIDDGGWRVEIKRYPELVRRGAYRLPADGTFPEYKGLSFPEPGTEPDTYGGYYTQAQIKDIVAYAEQRHVTIVPEIEMPGHNLAACMAYPSLVCSPDLQEAWQKESEFVFPNILCAGKESTYKFMQNVIDEVLPLFPSKVIHIGGDEVDKFLWTRCPDCLAKMKQLKTDKPEKLESYFVERMERYLNSKGRTMVGWDEILEGGLAPNAMVMSWRGTEGGVEAAKLGHKVVMSPVDWCYFNNDERGLPLKKVYSFDPAPASLGSARSAIVGAEACLWTETVPDRAAVEDHLFPRLLAFSQVVWAKTPESFAAFSKRLEVNLPSLEKSAPGYHR